MTEPYLLDVLAWGESVDESSDALRELRRVPARLGMLDADLGRIPADMGYAERVIFMSDYGVVSRSADLKAAKGRANSRLRALLLRYHARAGGCIGQDAVSAAWEDLVALVASHEGRPEDGAPWPRWQRRRLLPLVARARQAPNALDQDEIDRISGQINAGTRKTLRRAVRFLNTLKDVRDVPGLAQYVPPAPLRVPSVSARARIVRWESLPAPFRASFDEAARRCVEGEEDIGEEAIARIEAGEDPEEVMAEVEAAAATRREYVRDADKATERYRTSVRWLVRSYEDHGGDIEALADIQELMTSVVIRGAIEDHVARAQAGSDLKDPLRSTTLPGMLTPLATLARYGIGDTRTPTVIALLRRTLYDKPRAKLGADVDGEGAVADVVAAKLRRSPSMALAYANGPARLARVAQHRMAEARVEGRRASEKAGLNLYQAAVMLAIQMSRPLRPEVLRNLRLRAEGSAPANRVATAADDVLRFQMEAWEGKTLRRVAVTLRGNDAEIVREWIDIHRARWIELRRIEDNCYLFPGTAQPDQKCPDGTLLPKGTRSENRFVEAWRAGTRVLGHHITPHQSRHLVAMLILAARPGNYALVSSVLGNSEDVCRRHYGRDTGEAAAQASREAILAAHPDVLDDLRRRSRR